MKCKYLFLFLMLSTQLLYSQKKSMVNFNIYDRISYESLDSAKIELYFQDTIKISYKTLSQENGNYKLELDYHPGNYTLLADKEGYATGIRHFSIGSYRGSVVGIDNLLLEKERHIKMKDVTVTSTRIKMVMRGDTIVYDAAAFELAEGSMLDALVACGTDRRTNQSQRPGYGKSAGKRRGIFLRKPEDCSAKSSGLYREKHKGVQPGIKRQLSEKRSPKKTGI